MVSDTIISVVSDTSHSPGSFSAVGVPAGTRVVQIQFVDALEQTGDGLVGIDQTG